MTLAIPTALIAIGVSILFGRSRPVVPVAVIFTVIGMYIYRDHDWVGHQVTAGLDFLLTRLIG